MIAGNLQSARSLDNTESEPRNPTRTLEHLADCQSLRARTMLAPDLVSDYSARPAGPSLIHAGKQRHSGMCADSATRLEGGQPDSFARQPVELGRPHFPAAVARQVVVAQIVCHDQNNIGTVGGCLCDAGRLHRDDRDCKQQNCSFACP